MSDHCPIGPDDSTARALRETNAPESERASGFAPKGLHSRDTLPVPWEPSSVPVAAAITVVPSKGGGAQDWRGVTVSRAPTWHPSATPTQRSLHSHARALRIPRGPEPDRIAQLLREFVCEDDAAIAHPQIRARR